MRARNVKNASAATKAIIAGEPAPSCAIVGVNELQHIKDLVDHRDRAVAAEECTRREELRQRSEHRVAQWPNTIEAQRLRKEKARQERQAEDEERRRRLDDEEKALREAAKQRILDNANRHQYEQNDKVKAFTSKLFLATVLSDREQQIAMKAEKTAEEVAEAQEWAQLEKTALQRAEEAEVAKLRSARQRQVDLRKAQQDQLEGVRQRKIGERDANIAEGQAIKSRAQEALEEAQAKEAARRENQRSTNLTYVQANDESKVYRERRLEADRLENERIAEFARQKEVQMAERKKRADERFNAKLRRRQDIIDAQATRLAEINAAVEEREMKAMRDFDKERSERERREHAHRDRRQKEIDDFRAEQRQRNVDEKDKQAMESRRMREVWKQRAEILIDEELSERHDDRMRAERLQRFHVLQMQEKQQQSLHDKRREIEEGISLQEALKSEQDMYENYVSAVMGDYLRSGRGDSLVKRAQSMKAPQ